MPKDSKPRLTTEQLRAVQTALNTALGTLTMPELQTSDAATGALRQALDRACAEPLRSAAEAFPATTANLTAARAAILAALPNP